ncbi:cell wall-binding protein [Bacillus toyonensis]|nr:cell wall-binding protein [Bacillus toyonensis]MDT3495122.1 cell wall-binding protein [Bacillus toyonensis]MDT3495435.1 cell wall-binding protein [Bacillus toyonensis]MDT3495529.1 cell wall-binding protein [Bacillus toyonensis]
MNEKYQTSIPKVLPVGIAMGILFSASSLAGPLTENKVKADADTFGTIVTTFGEVYDAFLAEPFGKWLDETSAKSLYNRSLENSAYIAPSFQKGEFGITVFDYYKGENFSKQVKIVYADGKVEYKTIKHGQQLRIKQAGTIVDLTPDEPSLSKHDILYITQKQLDEGKTGVALTNWQTFYLESSNEGHYTHLADRFVRESFPGAYTKGGVLDIRYNFRILFNKLPEDKRKLGTATSEPVGKEVLSNYVTNDSKARTDFNNRVVNVFADKSSTIETPLALPFITLNDGKPYQIIPYKKGLNKVFVKTGSKYLSGKEGNKLQYSDSIGDDELFELVEVEPFRFDGKVLYPQFRLNNKNGVSLAGNMYVYQFGTDWSFKSELHFTAKNNNEVHNWLRAWYPSKENEKQKYDEVDIKDDETDSTKWTAKDSSGNVIENSWVNRGSDYYYAGSDGVFLKGWHEIEGKKYYFHPDYFGAVLSTSGSNGNHEVDGKYYHFDDKGILQQSAWRDRYYSDDSGVFIKEGLREIEGKMYYFQNYKTTTNQLHLENQNIILQFSDKGVLERASRLNGETLNSVTHVTLSEKTLVFDKDGSIRKNGVSKIFLPGLFDKKDQPALVYYSLEEGPNYHGWKEIYGKKFHFKRGIHYTFDGHQEIEGKRYYFNQDGEAKLTGFDKVDGKIYYYDDKGVMQKGWKEIKGKWYYFDESGAAKIGWFQVGGGYHFPYYGYFTYYAKEDGSIYTDTKVEINGKTYKFDSHGHKGY